MHSICRLSRRGALPHRAPEQLALQAAFFRGAPDLCWPNVVLGSMPSITILSNALQGVEFRQQELSSDGGSHSTYPNTLPLIYLSEMRPGILISPAGLAPHHVILANVTLLGESYQLPLYVHQVLGHLQHSSFSGSHFLALSYGAFWSG